MSVNKLFKTRASRYSLIASAWIVFGVILMSFLMGPVFTFLLVAVALIFLLVILGTSKVIEWAERGE